MRRSASPATSLTLTFPATNTTQTELPPDYVELEKRVDALKAVHTKLLNATSQYTNEAYDYPPNVRESITDLSRTVSDKVKLLSSANSAAEAQAAFTAPPSAKPQPKTFNHAIARASLAGAQQLAQSDVRGAGSDDHLAQGLEKYAVASEQVGEARLTQDNSIQHKFLSPWTTTLNTNLQFAARARKAVENSRLSLDAVKTKAKAKFGPNEGAYDDKTRTEIEKAEDDFVNQVEEATNVLRNTLNVGFTNVDKR